MFFSCPALAGDVSDFVGDWRADRQIPRARSGMMSFHGTSVSILAAQATSSGRRGEKAAGCIVGTGQGIMLTSNARDAAAGGCAGRTVQG